MGKRTGAYQAPFSNDVEMFRPDRIKQFGAICFLNSAGVLFEDPELRKSLLAFIACGKGFVGIHDVIPTFVQYTKYDQWPPFAQMLGATENGGHPWDWESMTVKVEDPKSPLNTVFHGDEFQIADQAFSFRSRPCATISTCSSPLMWRRPVSTSRAVRAQLNRAACSRPFAIRVARKFFVQQRVANVARDIEDVLGIHQGFGHYDMLNALPMHIFTRGEVDYLVGIPKFVRRIPREEFLNRQSQTGWLIQIPVFKKGDSRAPVPGLVVMAKAHQAPTGLPHPTPSSALLWHGKRIRGLNREMRHDNPDGTFIRGWHEHLWSPSEEDACVIQAQPEPKDRSLRGVLQWGLEKWNIEVEHEQESF